MTTQRASRTTRTSRAAALGAATALSVLSLPGVAVADPSDKSQGNSNDKQTICHATNSDTNPYVVITPNKNGDLDGHAKHTGPIWSAGLKAQHISWGDIIPPFDYNDHGTPAHFDGLNWTSDGQAWFANGCAAPTTGGGGGGTTTGGGGGGTTTGGGGGGTTTGGGGGGTTTGGGGGGTTTGGGGGGTSTGGGGGGGITEGTTGAVTGGGGGSFTGGGGGVVTTPTSSVTGGGGAATLPFTGARTGQYTAYGLGLLLAGICTLFAGRRKPVRS